MRLSAFALNFVMADPTQNPINPPVQPNVSSDMPLHTDLPPLPDYMMPENTTKPGPSADSTSGDSTAPPPDLPPVIMTPRKKFGGGKIIATILGIFVLVGGVTAGVLLTQQSQIFQQKAASNGSCPESCPTSGATTLSSCHPPQSDGTANMSICNKSGRTVNCGNESGSDLKCFICKTAGGKWTVLNSGACPTPTPTASPTPTPTATPTPTGPSLAITTDSFIDGQVGVSYRNSFYGEEYNDLNAKLSFSLINMPPGLSVPSALCGSSYPTDQPVDTEKYECALDGTPTTAGDYQVNVTLSDDAGRTVSKDIPITILPTTAAPPTSTPTPTPVSSPGAYECLSVKAYDTSWNALSDSALSSLLTGTQVQFCVASSGSPDEAQFNIDGTLEPVTTTVRPGSTDFCQTYTIVPTDTTVTVKAKIHYAGQGWFGENI
jgi:hypothetical protein